MRLAFYAPMKPPDHPVPSGDRNIARALIAAATEMGAHVTLASRFQSRDGTGDAATQTALIDAAQPEITRLIDHGTRADWHAWLTYHNYYKAPDLIGPAVSRALRIPYLQVESTRARKRLTGPWAAFAQAAEQATDAAELVFYFSSHDAEALHIYAANDQQLTHLRPFLQRSTLPRQTTGTGPMLSVGMMRAGDKLASYGLIAQTLAALKTPDWQLNIAGDGPARAQVEQMMKPFGPRVHFLGALNAEALQNAYADANLLLWPGVNEALGMVYLEAQATGLPIVAQDRPGMRDLLAPGAYPAVEDGAKALAAMADTLLQNPDLRQTNGTAARAHIARHHLLGPAAETLRAGLNKLGVSP